MATDRPVDALPSPCISVCQMDPQDGVCVGCYRTRAEIAAWRSMNQYDQRVLLDILQDRRARATGIARRPSGRRARRLARVSP
jgi:predicted Fe-S protein YdhL (DUF1289 family)